MFPPVYIRYCRFLLYGWVIAIVELVEKELVVFLVYRDGPGIVLPLKRMGLELFLL